MFLKSQKNQLGAIIKEAGLNPKDFLLEDKTELKITHRIDGYYFRIIVTQDPGRKPLITTIHTPSYTSPIIQGDKEVYHREIDKWEPVVGLFIAWIAWLKSEVEQPDLWSEMEETPHIFSDDEPLTDDRFTPAEIKQLKERVAEVEERISFLSLPPEAEAAITEAIREVPAKAKRFTKKELADLLVGTLVKEGFKWGLTTEHLGAVWTAVQYFFTMLIGN